MGRWSDAESQLEEGMITLDAPKQTVYTVAQANRLIKNKFAEIPQFQNIAITGEISNYKPHYSGHHYITLKDSEASIDCIWFKWKASHLNFTLENGLKVIATGKLDVYERGGRYNLQIDDMQPDGVGSLAIAYEQLKEKLQNKGYFDDSHKKSIVKFPKKIGVVTSPTGAVWQDIQNVATRRYPAAELILYPAQVQGKGGERDVASGIEYFNRETDVDTLIIGRGGGSMEDLWNFNEEIVADAIYNSRIPVISSVGHETDFTIADFVADMRAPTPSAAAELATPDSLEQIASIKTNYLRMLKALKSNIAAKKQLLDKVKVKNPRDIIQNYYLRLDNAYERLYNIVRTKLTKQNENLRLLAGKLDSLSPLAVISRGYSVAVVGGKTVRKTSDVAVGDCLHTKLSGGTVISEIKQVEEEK